LDWRKDFARNHLGYERATISGPLLSLEDIEDLFDIVLDMDRRLTVKKEKEI